MNLDLTLHWLVDPWLLDWLFITLVFYVEMKCTAIFSYFFILEDKKIIQTWNNNNSPSVIFPLCDLLSFSYSLLATQKLIIPPNCTEMFVKLVLMSLLTSRLQLKTFSSVNDNILKNWPWMFTWLQDVIDLL